MSRVISMSERTPAERLTLSLPSSATKRPRSSMTAQSSADSVTLCETRPSGASRLRPAPERRPLYRKPVEGLPVASRLALAEIEGLDLDDTTLEDWLRTLSNALAAASRRRNGRPGDREAASTPSARRRGGCGLRWSWPVCCCCWSDWRRAGLPTRRSGGQRSSRLQRTHPRRQSSTTPRSRRCASGATGRRWTW